MLLLADRLLRRRRQIAISVKAFGSYRTSGHLRSLFANSGAVSEVGGSIRGCGLLCCTGGS
jgi:hypothetical protein